MCCVEIYDSIKWNNWVAQLINNKRIKRHSFDSVFHATVEHNVFHASNPFSCHFTIDFLFSTLRFSSLWILFSLFFFFVVLQFSGSPYVRAISPLKAVAGDSYIMHCPFSGYPIEIIRWERSGQELVSSNALIRRISTHLLNICQWMYVDLPFLYLFYVFYTLA